jgi:hypothetical protein
MHFLRRPRRHLWERRLELLCLTASLCFMLAGLRVRENYHINMTSFIQTGPSGGLDPQEPLRLRLYAKGEDAGGGEGEKPVAVVSTLYTDDYVEGLRVLGHSLSTHNVTARRVALYLPQQVRTERVCALCLCVRDVRMAFITLHMYPRMYQRFILHFHAFWGR